MISNDSSVVFEKQNSSRTVMVSSQSASNLDFWIEENSNAADAMPLQKINTVYSASEGKGTFTFNFEPRYYRLTLYAVKKNREVSSDSIILKAQSAVDLRAHDEINFYLSSYGVQGTGTWSLYIYSGNWTLSADYDNVYAGIYDKTTGVCKSYVTDGNTDGIARDSFNRTDATAEYNFFAGNSSVSSLPGGTYLLKLIFTNISTGSKFYYTDDIVIMANQTLSARIVIPNIMQAVPATPSRLRAGYNPSSDSDFVYETEFCWNDNSNNEHGFELEVMDISSVCDWNINTSNKTVYDNKIKPLLYDYFSNGSMTQTSAFMDELWQNIIDSCSVTTQTYTRYSQLAGGSLDAGSTSAIVKLHYGKIYIARLRAENATGKSGNDYLNILLSDFSGNSGFSTTAWDSDAAGLSRYYISYYLEGGRFYDGTTDVSSYVPMFSTLTDKVFSSQRLDSVNYTSLLSPLTQEYTTGRTASLCYKDNGNSFHIWQKWLYGNGSDFSDALAGNIYSYSGCGNLYLYAYFDGGAYDVGQSYSLRTSSVSEPKDADIVITAHPAGAAVFTPFQNDTEATGKPIYLSQGLEVNGNFVNFVVSKSDYRYVNFMLNKTLTGASAVSYTINEHGGSSVSIATKSPDVGYIAPGGGSADYIYCQLDLEGTYGTISGFETGKVYCVNYEITQGNNIYKFSVKFAVNN